MTEQEHNMYPMGRYASGPRQEPGRDVRRASQLLALRSVTTVEAYLALRALFLAMERRGEQISVTGMLTKIEAELPELRKA